MGNERNLKNLEPDWTKQHCGVYLCTYEQVHELMPAVIPLLQQLAIENLVEEWEFYADLLIDVKVHMLMPKQFPCIPDWHCDFRPRNDKGTQEDRRAKVGTGEQMYIYTSGAPYTEFINAEGKITQAITSSWHSFTQDDWHRGTRSEEHQWRGFLRVIPAHLAHAAFPLNMGT